MFAPLVMIPVMTEVIVGTLSDFILRGDAHAGKVGVEICRIEVADFAVRFIHGNDAVHHHLSEERKRDAEILGSFL